MHVSSQIELQIYDIGAIQSQSISKELSAFQQCNTHRLSKPSDLSSFYLTDKLCSDKPTSLMNSNTGDEHL